MPCCLSQIVAFCGFLEYVISQIKMKPGYIPGDYVGSNDLFDGGEGHDGWRNFQVGLWSGAFLPIVDRG